MTRAKPDCIGERFGYLTVLGKRGRSPTDNRQLWKLQCKCGSVIERTRGNFVNRANVSCGCRRQENARNRAKPNCTGQRFGYLTVLGKAGRSPDDRQLWKLQCDCGNVIERPRCNFAIKPNPSCGCQKRLTWIEHNQKRAKPDCTGQRFGRLVVLGKGLSIPDKRNYSIQLWRLQCDCGKVIERPRNSFEDKGQISCGCAKRLGLIDNKRRPVDISNQRFGNLQAIALTGKKDKYNQPTWRLFCDCGNTCELSLKKLNHKQHQNLWINCGDRSKHPEFGTWYPQAPNPYPKEAGELLAKYLPLTELNYQQIDSAVEDEKRDRLLRVAWILTYRRSLGEEISELHEARYIRKCLRYCSIDVFWRRKVESQGGFLYDVSGNKRQIGDAMTNLTSNDYPVIETSGINSIASANPVSKHLRFRRC